MQDEGVRKPLVPVGAFRCSLAFRHPRNEDDHSESRDDANRPEVLRQGPASAGAIQGLGRKRPGRRRAPPEPRHQRRGSLRMVRSHPQRAGAPEAYLPGLFLRSMRPPSAREDREAGGLLEAPPPLVRCELHARRGPEQLRHQAQRYGGLPRRDLPQREDSRRRALHAAEVHRQNAAHRPLPGPSPGDSMVGPSSRASDHAPGSSRAHGGHAARALRTVTARLRRERHGGIHAGAVRHGTAQPHPAQLPREGVQALLALQMRGREEAHRRGPTALPVGPPKGDDLRRRGGSPSGQRPPPEPARRRVPVADPRK